MMEEKIFREIKELKDKIESLSLSTKEILTLEEAVTYLQVSKSYLYKLTFKKDIPFYKPSGKLIYFKREDLVNWILNNKQMYNQEVENDIFNSLKRGRNGK